MRWPCMRDSACGSAAHCRYEHKHAQWTNPANQREIRGSSWCDPALTRSLLWGFFSVAFLLLLSLQRWFALAQIWPADKVMKAGQQHTQNVQLHQERAQCNGGQTSNARTVACLRPLRAFARAPAADTIFSRFHVRCVLQAVACSCLATPLVHSLMAASCSCNHSYSR